MKERVIAALFMALGCLAYTNQNLTFEDRVMAQGAIERVYYNHRIWPRENPGPKPSFDQMISRAAIEAKVTDYLKKSAALEKFWQRPLTAEQLQAEMDRMAKGSKDPDTLRELFAALGNDPHLIAECLARPLLADRLIRSWFARDSRFHAETQACAEGALDYALSTRSMSGGDGEYTRGEILLEEDTGPEPGRRGGIRLSLKEFELQRAALPKEGEISDIREADGNFYFIKTLSIGDRRMEIERLSFRKRGLEDWLDNSVIAVPKDGSEAVGEISYILSEPAPTLACVEQWINQSLGVPPPRMYHAAVWTGSEMIVWGGWFSSYCNECPAFTWIYWQDTGGRYDPSTDSWTITSTGANCPTARAYHTAVWTGTEMIVWGGDYGGNTGVRYNPSSDTWAPTSTGTNCPSARSHHTAVWTGTRMIIWGGGSNTGGRYDPTTDTWLATSTGTNCPSARSGHTAVWRGSRMIIWGGSSLPTGGKYDPVADTWLVTSTGTNCPSARYDHTAVWTGTVMIVWGGRNGSTYLNSGAMYAPVADTWTPLSTGANCPSARSLHAAVWTGTQMIVWGGDDGSTYLNSGGRYTPGTDTWASTSTGSNCPEARAIHTAVWTGTEMIVWGGDPNDHDSPPKYKELNTGARYSPSTDSWVPTRSDSGAPSKRAFHTAAWTGTEMIILGGYWDFYIADEVLDTWGDGGRYFPSTDTWNHIWGPVSDPARMRHSAVWSGTEMIVWGGYYETLAPFGDEYLNTGGRYNPSTNSWLATSTGTGCPSARADHTAVWTGTEMIVWGGYRQEMYFPSAEYYLATGGKYSPSTDTWTATSVGAFCPSGRRYHTAVWTGTEMTVWGGSPTTNTGGRYIPSTDSWTATSVGSNCPSARFGHTAVWTGTEMIVWGTSNTGGRYTPSTDTWFPTSIGPNCPSGRGYYSAVWTGSEMIIWGGYTSASPYYTNTGGRYSPSSDVWLETTVENSAAERRFHTAIWTGSQMIVWGGKHSDEPGYYLYTGGIYSPGTTLAPVVVGSSQGCAASPPALSTDTYSVYQWMRNGLDIGGAVGRTYTATQDGAYSVRVTDLYGCTGTSTDKPVTFYPPEVSGMDHNTCPDTIVSLSSGDYPSYQWSRDGQAISGATEQSYIANLSGDYSVSTTPPAGCAGTSASFTVTISFCSASEVSPDRAIFPLRATKDGGSSTGYYLYFQKIAGADGYNIYEGDIGTWYSHASASGNVCAAAVTDLATGEMRAELALREGNHYYLVTAYGGGVEGPSGFDSSAAEIDPSQSTCSP